MVTPHNGETLDKITQGTKEIPYPITLKFINISDAFLPKYWAAHLEEGCTHGSINDFSTKQRNLDRALAGYADFKGVNELKGTCYIDS